MDETTSNSLTGSAAGPVIQAGNIDTVIVGTRDNDRPISIPRHLNQPPAIFVNRTPIHQAMNGVYEKRLAAGQPAAMALHGPSGIGVTATVGKWFWDNEDRFPDGCLWISLSGPDQDAALATLAGFHTVLVDLGVPHSELPASVVAAQARFRTLTYGKRLLMVLDGATRADQVRPFLLNSPFSSIVVTAKRPIPGLRAMGFQSWQVDPLDAAFGQELLRAHLRLDAGLVDEPTETALLTVCGGFPLMIMHMAELLSAATDRRARRLLDKIRERGVRGLSGDGQQIVAEGWDFTYRQLPDSQRRVYRLLALHPGVEFSAEAAAALLGIDEDDAVEELDRLVASGLLAEVGDHRFRFHGTVRWHGERCVRDDEDARSVEAAVERILTWYLRTAVGYDQALSERWRVGPHYQVIPARRESTDPRGAALRWLETERSNLVEAVMLAERCQLDDLCWQLCEALWGLFHLHRHYDDWIATHQVALNAAVRPGNNLAEMRLSSQLGAAYLAVADLDLAADCFRQSLAAARRLGPAQGVQRAQGVQSALEWLGKVAARRGDVAAALDYWAQSWAAVADAPEQDRQRMYALLRLQRGRLFVAERRFAEAAAELAEAGAFFASPGETEERDNRAKVAWALAQARRGLGSLADAVEAAGEALIWFEADGSQGSQADVLLLLADLRAEQGERDVEQRYLSQALAILVRLGDPKVAEIQARLA
jgi:tetratricopeptide (TPR) repeat protein